jgi:hypothetical protein
MTRKKNAHAKNTLQSMKSPHRHRKLVDMSLELGSTYQGIAAMVGTSLRVVFDLEKLEANVVTLTSTEFSSSNQPVGSRSKISTPRYYFREDPSQELAQCLDVLERTRAFDTACRGTRGKKRSNLVWPAYQDGPNGVRGFREASKGPRYQQHSSS